MRSGLQCAISICDKSLRNSAKEFDKLTGQLEILDNQSIENVQKQIESLKVNIAKYEEKEIERVKGDLEQHPERKSSQRGCWQRT